MADISALSLVLGTLLGAAGATATLGLAGWRRDRIRHDQVERVKEELQRAQRQRAASQDAALGRALVDAHAARATRRAFLARISHDLRTPMAAILGLSELSLERVGEGQARDAVKRLRDAAMALGEQVEELLDLERVDGDASGPQPEGFAVRGLLDEVVELCRARLTPAGPGVSARVGAQVPETMVGDPASLRQLLVEVLVLGAEVSVGREIELVLDDGSDDPGSVLRACVYAPGAGHAALGATESLRVAARLATQLGGELHLGGSEPGAPLLCLRLPVGLPEFPDEITLIDPILLHGLPILVALRDPRTSAMVSDELGSWGMRPVHAGSVEELRARLAEGWASGRSVPLVLLDLELTPGQGWLVVEELSRGPAAVEGVLVLLPPGAGGDVFERARAHGAAASLASPLALVQVLEALLRVVSSRRERDTLPPRPPASPVVASSRGLPRVLLADDHEVNLELFRTVLEASGVEVVVARDGNEAVLRYRREGPFDLVLMDLRMPGLDGEEATRQIRRGEERGGGPRVPIIALTASCLPGDRERLLRAGLDGSLTKPLRRADLVELVRGLTRPAERIGPLSEEAPMQSSPWRLRPLADQDPALVIDPALLQRVTDGDQNLIDDLVVLMLKEIPSDVARLTEAVEAADPKKIVAAAHKLRGAAGNVGGVRVQAAAGRMVDAALAGQVGQACQELPFVMAELERLREALEGMRAARG